MKAREVVSLIALIIVVVGALNLLVEGLFSFNVIEWVFGGLSVFSRILYIVMGLAGLWLICDSVMAAAGKRHAHGTPAQN